MKERDITRGPMIKMFESPFGPNMMKEFILNQPVANYFSEKEFEEEFLGDRVLPKRSSRNKDLTNTSLASDKIEEYKEYYKAAYREYLSVYHDSIFRKFVEKMVNAEIQMIQIRCLLEIDPKYTILKQSDKDGNWIQYIVARAQFYRSSIKRDEVTFYVGKTDEWGEDLEELKNDPKFTKAAIEGLSKVMIENMG